MYYMKYVIVPIDLLHDFQIFVVAARLPSFMNAIRNVDMTIPSVCPSVCLYVRPLHAGHTVNKSLFVENGANRAIVTMSTITIIVCVLSNHVSPMTLVDL